MPGAHCRRFVGRRSRIRCRCWSEPRIGPLQRALIRRLNDETHVETDHLDFPLLVGSLAVLEIGDPISAVDPGACHRGLTNDTSNGHHCWEAKVRRPATRCERVADIWVATDLKKPRSCHLARKSREPSLDCDVEVSGRVLLDSAVAVAAPVIPRPVSAAAKARTFQRAGRVMLCSFSSGPRTSRISPDSVSAVIPGWDEDEHSLTRVASRPERSVMRPPHVGDGS